MVHEKDSVLARKIWAGEYLGENGALARGLIEYHENRKRTVWVSTLLSALGQLLPDAYVGNWQALKTCTWCFFQLEPHVQHWERFAMEHRGDLTRYSPDECDVIASALLMRYRVPWASGLHTKAAKRYARSAYLRTRNDPGAHTPALALLTLLRIIALQLKHSHRRTEAFLDEAAEYMTIVRQRAPHITDANQRSRVYRGIAEVTVGLCGHTHNATLAARCALDTADAIPGIAADVRAKNAAMRKRLKL